MITIRLILILLAVVCFACAAAGVAARVNLTAAGLALWLLSTIVTI